MSRTSPYSTRCPWVQCGRGLVGDEQLRVAGQRHGDHDALLLTAGHLVRVAVQPPLRVRNVHLAEELQCACARLVLGHVLVGQDGLDHLVADGEHRVERRHRLLEDHADFLAADLAHARLGHAHHVATEEGDLARLDHGRLRRQQAHQREGRDRLARARLPHDPEGLALAETDVVGGREVHCADDLVLRVEVGAQAFDVEKRFAHGRGFSGGRAYVSTRREFRRRLRSPYARIHRPRGPSRSALRPDPRSPGSRARRRSARCACRARWSRTPAPGSPG